MGDRGYSKKSIIILAALGLFMIADLVMLHFFVTQKFYGYAGTLVKVFDRGGVIPQKTAALILSAVAGGLMVFAVIKLIELLGTTLGALHHTILAGMIPAIFLIVHCIVLLVMLIKGEGRFVWSCAAAAYAVGLGLWALTIRWRSETDKIKTFIRELREK